MCSNITSSYAYGIIKKNGLLTGEHRAENLTVLVLILVLCLNAKIKNAVPYWLSVQIQALFPPNPHHDYLRSIWMEYNFFHKNHFLFSVNCVRLPGGPVGIAGLKMSMEKCLASSQTLYWRASGHPYASFPDCQQEAGVSLGTSLCHEAADCHLPALAGLAQTHSFWGEGRGPSWSTPVDLSGFLSGPIRLEGC